MVKYIALLRGINIGGRNKILMKDLKNLFIELGYTNPITYIQSGNVIFESSKKTALTDLSMAIKKGIQQAFNLDIPILVITKTELIYAFENNPFYSNDIDITRLHVTFLKEKPNAKLLSDINAESYNRTDDIFEIKETFAFLNCEKKYSQSKFSNAFFEKKLDVQATTRNWRTLSKILELV